MLFAIVFGLSMDYEMFLHLPDPRGRGTRPHDSRGAARIDGLGSHRDE